MSQYLILIAACFLAGVMNAAAGGGSFFSFPALLAVGVPPVNANATNTVSLWPGQIASIFAFRSELRTVRPMVLPVVLASAIGGVAGAIALLKTNQGVFLKLVPWLLLFATILFAVSEPVMKQLRRLRAAEPAQPIATLHISTSLFIGLTLVCFYIGYFGAGSGFLIITLFSFTGLKGLTQINTLKVICTSVANGIAVITFIVAGAVYWTKVPFMLLAALAGGYLGAHYSKRMSPLLLKTFIIVTGFALSAYYFRGSL